MAENRKRGVTQEEVLSFLKSKPLDDAARYQRAGRRYRTLTDDQLRDQWKAAMRAMASDVTDEGFRSVHTDLTSELDLRGIEPPFNEVQTEVDAYLAKSDRAMRKTMAEDPEQAAEIEDGLRSDIEEFRAAKKNSN